MVIAIIIIILLSAALGFSFFRFGKEKKLLLQQADALRTSLGEKDVQIGSLNDLNGLLNSRVSSETEKNSEMEESLKFLLRNVLTPRNYIKSFFPEFFISENSEDKNFYKFFKRGDIIFVCCGTCGESGAGGIVKNILNVIFLDGILERSDVSRLSSGAVLDMLREKYSHLEISGSKDDTQTVSVCIINQREKFLEFSSAYSNLCLVRKSYPGTSRKEVDVHEFTGDRMNFAVSFGHRKNYLSQRIEIEKDDKIYLQTGAGFSRQTLLELASLTMKEQAECFNNMSENGTLLIGIALKVKASNENFKENAETESGNIG